jgi:hypothetical protein
MQNRYVADVGDYVKFAILRKLAIGRRLGVVWWLFPNEDHNADGSHRKYLDRPTEWRHFDWDLFDALLKIQEEKVKDVRAIEVAGILPDAAYASEVVPGKGLHFSARPGERRSWIERAKAKVRDCNLVFLDPDNGIAPQTLSLTEQRAGKSVTIEEIKSLQKTGRAMVVYHHQTRFKGGHEAELHDLYARLRKGGLQVSGALRAKPWSPRAFFIINGDEELAGRAEGIASAWGNQISWHPEAELLRGSE